MTALDLFAYNGQDVRVIVRDGDPWFVAADVCAVLGIVKVSNSVALLDEDERGAHTVGTSSGDQHMLIVSEPGLYSLIFRSRKPGAKAFKRWITHDVVPTIRRTGSYGVALPSVDVSAIDRRALALMVVEAEDARAAAEARVAELEPKAQIADRIALAEGSVSPTAAAKLLQTAGCRIRTREIFEYMHANRLIYRFGGAGHWLPYAEAQDAGHVVLIHGGTHLDENNVEKANKPKVQVTGRGINWLATKLLAERGSTVVGAGQTQMYLVAGDH